jgi:hypothetical protein
MIQAALAVIAVPAFAQSPQAILRRVAVVLGPSKAPDPFGPARKSLGELFAKSGLIDGKDCEVAIYRAQSLDSRRGIPWPGRW